MSLLPVIHPPYRPLDSLSARIRAAAKQMAGNEHYAGDDLRAGDLEVEGGGAEDMVDAAAVRRCLGRGTVSDARGVL